VSRLSLVVAVLGRWRLVNSHVPSLRRGCGLGGHPGWRMAAVASYSLNERAVARARRLIDGRQYVLDSDWGDVQPRA